MKIKNKPFKKTGFNFFFFYIPTPVLKDASCSQIFLNRPSFNCNWLLEVHLKMACKFSSGIFPMFHVPKVQKIR